MHRLFSSIKKLLLLLVFFAITLSGCGAGNADSSTEESGTASSAQSTPHTSENATDILLKPDDTAPPTAQNASSAQEEGSALTMTEAVEYMKLLPPAELALPGESMRAYSIYAEEGIVLVDGRSCIKLGVYELVPDTQTNHVLGIYLLARDQSHLYRLDPISQEVQELQVSGLTPDPAIDDKAQ